MIRYIQGDATVPQAKGSRIIAHICNDVGGWGAGFVVAVSKRWKGPEQSYREWHKQAGAKLGNVQFVVVEEGPTYQIEVANMIAQEGIGWGSKGPPIRYNSLKECLAKVAEHAKDRKASVHMPRIGCGLAGGRWDKIEPLIQETMGDLDVTVYDFD